MNLLIAFVLRGFFSTTCDFVTQHRSSVHQRPASTSIWSYTRQPPLPRINEILPAVLLHQKTPLDKCQQTKKPSEKFKKSKNVVKHMEMIKQLLLLSKKQKINQECWEGTESIGIACFVLCQVRWDFYAKRLPEWGVYSWSASKGRDAEGNNRAWLRILIIWMHHEDSRARESTLSERVG